MQWDVAFTVYTLRDCNALVVLKYFEQHNCDCQDVLREALELRFLDANMDALAKIGAGEGQWLQCHQLATQWLVEFDLAEWVNKMNAEVGMAPASEDVYHKYVSLLQNVGLSVHHAEGTTSWKKWVTRWKRKWNARHGILTTHVADSTTDLRDKATRWTQQTWFSEPKKNKTETDLKPKPALSPQFINTNTIQRAPIPKRPPEKHKL